LTFSFSHLVSFSSAVPHSSCHELISISGNRVFVRTLTPRYQKKKMPFWKGKTAEIFAQIERGLHETQDDDHMVGSYKTTNHEPCTQLS
jgi:hypothetical protein